MPKPMQVAREPLTSTFAPQDCPRCGSDQIWPEMNVEEPFGLQCCDCGWVGPRDGSDANPDPAKLAWDREAKQVQEARKKGLKLHFDQPMRKVNR